MTFIEKIQTAYDQDGVEQDRGDIIQFVVIAAIVVVAAVAIAGWVMTAAMNRGADLAECVEGVNTYNTGDTGDACYNEQHGEDNSFKEDKSYQERF